MMKRALPGLCARRSRSLAVRGKAPGRRRPPSPRRPRPRSRRPAVSREHPARRRSARGRRLRGQAASCACASSAAARRRGRPRSARSSCARASVFSAERMRADLEAILKLGIFDDASAYGLRVQQGASVALLYSVHDRPLVAHDRLRGREGPRRCRARREAPDREGEPLRPRARRARSRSPCATSTARAATRRRAWWSSPSRRQGSPDHVRVRLMVDEGPLSRFTKIDFKGQQEGPRGRAPQGGRRSRSASPSCADELERAALLVTALYYDRGFVQVRVDTEIGTPNAQGALPPTIVVEEGDVLLDRRTARDEARRARREGAPRHGACAPARSRSSCAAKIVEDLERVNAFFTARQPAGRR